MRLRNLGPKCAADLKAANIQSVEEFIEVGVEEAFLRILIGRRNRGMNMRGMSVNYLYALHGAFHDLDWREIPAEAKAFYKTWLQDIRDSGQFG